MSSAWEEREKAEVWTLFIHSSSLQATRGEPDLESCQPLTMLCNKKRGTDAVVEEPLSIVDEVIGNEDLAFLISSVSKKKAFSPIFLFSLNFLL